MDRGVTLVCSSCILILPLPVLPVQALVLKYRQARVCIDQNRTGGS